MLPPQMTPIRQLSLEEGISEETLHIWRRDARNKWQLFPEAEAGPEGWRSREKFATAPEAAALNEADLDAYCRERGLYPDQIKAWRQACEAANDWAQASTAKVSQASKEERKWIRILERELARKERAVAEAAALLVLRKMATAIWGEEEDK